MARYGEIKMSEVARRAGVSGAAVSRYLNDSGYLSKEKREAIRRAIEELGFEPPADHASRYPRCKTFGILLPPFQYDGYGLEMKAQFTRQAEKAGYHVLDCYFDLSRVPLVQALETICRERVCGIYVPMVPMMKLSDEEVDYLRDSRVPVVLISEFADSYPPGELHPAGERCRGDDCGEAAAGGGLPSPGLPGPAAGQEQGFCPAAGRVLAAGAAGRAG